MNNEFLQKRMIRHGEVCLLPLESLPVDAVEGKTVKQFTVAHSESGHSHIAVGSVTELTGFDVKNLREQLTDLLYPNAEITGLVRVNKDSKLEHQKSFDKHETKNLLKGLYVVIVKQSYNYFRKAMERVQD